MRTDRGGRTLGLLALAAACMAGAGCAKVETHLTVKPDGSSDMAVQARVVAPLAAMLTQALEKQGVKEQLPLPGLQVTERDEGLEHVWEIALPVNPLAMSGACQVNTETRALSTRYSLEIDPERANPLNEMKLLYEPNGPRVGVRLASLDPQAAQVFEAQLPEGLADQLKNLGDLLGGPEGLKLENLNPEALLKELQPALCVHMPGRLLETSGEQTDEWTARWRFDPAQLVAGAPKMTARSELADPDTMAELSRRLASHLEREVDPVALGDLVYRGVLPNPVVEERHQERLEVHVYGALFALVTGLDELIGPDKSNEVVRALGLAGDEPELWVAMRAAKRVPELREQERPAEMSVESLVELLRGAGS